MAYRAEQVSLLSTQVSMRPPDGARANAMKHKASILVSSGENSYGIPAGSIPYFTYHDFHDRWRASPAASLEGFVSVEMVALQLVSKLLS
jgi:hypothetical protein